MCGPLYNSPDAAQVHQVYGPRRARRTQWNQIYVRCFPDITVVHLRINLKLSILWTCYILRFIRNLLHVKKIR